jgi:hypothetical protein
MKPSWSAGDCSRFSGVLSAGQVLKGEAGYRSQKRRPFETQGKHAGTLQNVDAPTKIPASGRAWFCTGHLLGRAADLFGPRRNHRAHIGMNGRPRKAVPTHAFRPESFRYARSIAANRKSLTAERVSYRVAA